MRITRHEEFEVAHVLPGHFGACANLHGHTYKIEVTIQGEQKQEEFGMVMDFTHLKNIIKDVIPDHKFVCSNSFDGDALEYDIVNVLDKHGLEYEMYPFMTTAENMVQYFAHEIEKRIQAMDGYSKVEVVEVKLWETTNSYAHYIKGEQICMAFQ